MSDDKRNVVNLPKHVQSELFDKDDIDFRFLSRNLHKSLYFNDIMKYKLEPVFTKTRCWYHWLKDLDTIPLCPVCAEKPLVWRKSKYSQTCSRSCGNSNRFANNERISDQLEKISKDSNGNLEYVSGNYIDCTSNITVKNNTCGCEFPVIYRNLKKNPNYCPKHGAEYRIKKLNNEYWANRTDSVSKMHLEIYEFILSLGIPSDDILNNDRTVLNGKELDIYLPAKLFAIEVNGVYWHSYNNGHGSREHYNKSLQCEKAGILLFHIYEDQWVNNKDIVKSMIVSRLNLSDRIFARNTKFTAIDNHIGKEFFQQHHIHGNALASNYFALIDDNDNIVAAMSFRSPRFKSTAEYEIVRFANIKNTNVIGSASKLFTNAVISLNMKSVETFSSNDIGHGAVYSKLGFVFIDRTKPGYFYSKNLVRYSRQKFMKHRLVEYDNYDINKTEFEIVSERGYYKVYDAGNKKWRWESKAK